MHNRTRCRHCGSRLVAGRAGIHARGECRSDWYQRERAQHPRPPGRPPGSGRKPDPDLPPDVIERIMARRALVQRYERAMGLS